MMVLGKGVWNDRERVNMGERWGGEGWGGCLDDREKERVVC